MKIFIAGNTPYRDEEDREWLRKGIISRRLVSFFFVAKEQSPHMSMANVFRLYIGRGKR